MLTIYIILFAFFSIISVVQYFKGKFYRLIQEQSEDSINIRFSNSDSNRNLLSLTSWSRSKEESPSCANKYSNKRFAKKSESQLPPILYTFPGSGNTWARLLIEYATGIYTGSVYNDMTLLKVLPGEFKCNPQVSAIKVHPHTHGFRSLYKGKFDSDDNKCKIGGVKKIEKVILLIRDPFDSIWSEYQRRLTQNHVIGVEKLTFDWPRWQANAASMANLYFRMWDREHSFINSTLPEQNRLFIKYEDLKDKWRRSEALKKIASFIYPNRQSEFTDERLECSFTLAEDPKAHRTVRDADMKKSIAYTKPLVCRMWALFGKYAIKHGYKSRDYDCSDGNYTKIPLIRVGPQGEYNEKWRQPGVKAFDLGGYNRSEYLPPKNEKAPSSHSRNYNLMREEGRKNRFSKNKRRSNVMQALDKLRKEDIDDYRKMIGATTRS